MHLFSPAKPPVNSLDTPQANSRSFQYNINNLPAIPLFSSSSPSSTPPQTLERPSAQPPASSILQSNLNSVQTNSANSQPVANSTGAPNLIQKSAAPAPAQAPGDVNSELKSLLQKQGVNFLQSFGPAFAREFGVPLARNIAPQLADRLGPPLAEKVALPLIQKVGFPLAKRVGLPLAKKLGGLLLKRIGL